MADSGIRINKYLASVGVASRRAIDQMLKDGRISVNGKLVPASGVRINPENAAITIDGVLVKLQTDHVYYLVNKPVGVMTTVKDPKVRKAIVSLVPKIPRVFPVGRLDQDSSGLVLLTNDGAVAYRLTHPSFATPKTYRVHVTGSVTPTVLRRMSSGVRLKEGLTGKAIITKLGHRQNETILSITINQGWNRQIRRMAGVCGLTVTQLERISFGPLALGDIEPGSFRTLTVSEAVDLAHHLNT